MLICISKLTKPNIIRKHLKHLLAKKSFCDNVKLNMSVLLSISVIPIGKGESLSSFVAKAVKEIQKSGLPYEITPMETIIEGDSWEEVMQVAQNVFNALKDECNRLVITLKIDYRKGRKQGLIKKVESVKQKLQS